MNAYDSKARWPLQNNETNMVDQYSHHLTVLNGGFYPTRPHRGMWLCDKFSTKYKKMSSPRVRATTQIQSQTTKQHESAALDRNSMNENHVIHNVMNLKTR
jgi:hypothetical protein